MATTTKRVSLKPLEVVQATLRIEGITSLICQGLTGTEVTDKPGDMTPEQEMESNLYPKVNGQNTFPSQKVNNACVDAAKTHVPGIDKTQARGAFFITPEYLIIEAGGPNCRSDAVLRGPNKAPAIVYRPEFIPWEMEIPIEFSKSGVLSLDQIVMLFNSAGFHVGIGAWNPPHNGIHGRFRVVTNDKGK